MIYSGNSIKVTLLDNGVAELQFDLQGESVNKFNQATLEELREVGQTLSKSSDVKGLLVTSAKDCFIVGADITEFGAGFSRSEEEIAKSVEDVNTNIFNVIEDLPFPSATAINGVALGGGLEMALCTDYRVLAEGVKIGLPEVKLGIMPGFGGTVRLPRIIGADNAIEWIAAGKEARTEEALKVGAVDAVVSADKVREAALDLVNKAIAGDFDWQARREEKKGPLKLNDTEALMVFETSKAYIAGQAGKHYPAPVTAVKSMQKAAKESRDEALKSEAYGFVKLAKTDVSRHLINLFLSDQALMKKAKTVSSDASAVEQAAVLGAGIMGGGIAYQSAYKGTPIIMKDINQAGIDLGLNEASKLLSKLQSRGRISAEKMANILNSITPSLSYGDFDKVDLVVEAVVENPKVKHAVLSEAEDKISEDTILTSNTSTISIDHLAEPLKRPENFLGMHFFNPVHKMPLVEVIRGAKTSDEAVAKTVNYALAMGKKPVVVRDCPGFLVNRILFPYMGAFMQLLRDGADFVKVDKIMENFGWPMGPAYLCDVVGIDTGVHGADVMAEGFPDRMGYDYKSANHVMFENNRLGQKNGKGYYKYELDKKGKPKKKTDPDAVELLKPVVAEPKDFSEEEIVDRLMVAFCLEAVRCLEEGIADSATDVDMALIYGLGFPPFRGGPMRYIDDMGVAEFVAKADKYAELGNLFKATDKLREMAANGERFYA
ncbi:fatty acid oxidation complex subunit alpha FadB [Marinibactrum halimedae]|uniref:enoyl-CoA hydratase n=1 Tax=Marinibactrum halimedae TaxID=1444977 RepID=A0AA37T5M0_9GAMM|nr:fatty acid oxidation complex subunit alpha FadB [Marinibactrum halimedae]MCD9460934.1 fatty acid oxidation complex subunit alpha FadB [Marinibactrum halimedae]GLS27405.1 fatty acid oxidation complex subunit alpha [Marinibactrum halimedae]